MPVKDLIGSIIANASTEDLVELAEAVRQGVLEGVGHTPPPSLLLDKEKFAEFFCIGVSGDPLSRFEQRYPKECHWYLRVLSDTLVKHSFEEDCRSDFADFSVLGTQGKTLKFFSQLEDCAVDDKPHMRIVDLQSKVLMLPPMGWCRREQPVWEFVCEIQGYPDSGDIEAFLSELRDGHGYSFIQVIAPDRETVVAFFGVKEEWDDIFCQSWEQPKYNQLYLDSLNSEEDTSQEMSSWEDRLYWIDGWGATSFRNLIEKPLTITPMAAS